MIQQLPFDAFAEQLRLRLLQPLPGEAAQNRMTSRPAGTSTAEYLVRKPDHRRSAVLLLVYPVAGIPTTALIVRPEYDGVHSGQLALPGGRFEEEDGSLRVTALRETLEEVGVLVREEQVIGQLTPIYIPVSNFLVQPFVAILEQRPVFIPDPLEVGEVIEVPLEAFLRPDIKTKKTIRINEKMEITAPCYLINDRVLWGATAMMFSEFEALIG